MERARERAESEGARAVALFFDPHPKAFFRPESASPLLTPPARRVELLEARGASVVDVRRFDASFAHLSPEAFVAKVLVADHAASAVVVGPDFRFGHGRQGDVETLRALGEAHGFDVEIVAPVEHDGAVVSSTRVRSLLQAGDVVGAQRLLGRVHDVTGLVVEGDRRGRAIGFPTANLDTGRGEGSGGMLPGDGVYAVVARRLDGGELSAPAWAGVANLGVRPTFAAGRSAEVHLFDFDGDLYGAALRVGFVARVRGERKFAGVDALVAQIREDAAAARSLVATLRRDEAEALRWI